MSFDSDVRWFTNLTINGYTMTGMPRCSGTAGDLKGMLDVFLNTGANIKTLTGLSRANTTATATFSGSPGFVPDQVIEVAGANQSEWNDLYRVATVSSNSVTFTVPVGHTASPTGTITMKAASAGWTVADDGNNIYRAKASAVDMTGLTLYLDDSNARYGLVRGYESWSGGVGSGPFPTVAQKASCYSHKSSTASTTDRPYVAIIDRGLIYLFMAFHASYADTFEPLLFGDIVSFKEGDQFHCVLCANTTQTPNYPNVGGFNDFYKYDEAACSYLARSFTQSQITGPVTYRKYGPGENGSYLGGGGYTYPSPPDNGLLFHDEIRIAESSSIPRGLFPGLAVPLHSVPFSSVGISSDIPTKPGHKYVAIKCTDQYVGAGPHPAQVLIDIIGPWR